MSKGSRAWVAILLATSLLAGCVGQSEEPTNDTEPSSIEDNASDPETSNASTSSSSQGQSPDDNASTSSTNGSASADSGPNRTASLSANTTQGQAPLPVGFTANASEPNGTWRLVFGDGNETNGTGEDLPATVNHTYSTAGNVTAEFFLTYPNGDTVNDRVNLTIEAPDTEDGSEDTGPTYQPRHKEWTDAATFGVPYLLGEAVSRGEFVQTALDNGANGTFVLGYDVNVTVKTSELSVSATADAVEGVVPDYDLVLIGPDGSTVGDSGNGGTNEGATVPNPDPGTYTIGLLFWAGADAPPAPQFPVTITADAV